MDKPSRETGVIGTLIVMAFTISVACTRSHDSMVVLSDRIEDEAQSLRWSKKQDTTVAHELKAAAPWVVLFVPANGFDEDAAISAGVPEDSRQEIVRRLEAWS